MYHKIVDVKEPKRILETKRIIPIEAMRLNYRSYKNKLKPLESLGGKIYVKYMIVGLKESKMILGALKS